MKLIGAGFGRTGTKSLKTALEQLGYGPCYHMSEVLDSQKNPGHLQIWDKIGQGELADWQNLFQNYQSTLDWPASAFYRELMSVFPQAKVLLSVRDAQSWYESAMSTIFRPNENVDIEISNLDREIFRQMVDNIILQGVFHGRIGDRDHAISVFLQHIERVKQDVPAERLLVYNVRESWEPLCHFLNVPIPNVPFPHENSTQEFQARISTSEISQNSEISS